MIFVLMYSGIVLGQPKPEGVNPSPDTNTQHNQPRPNPPRPPQHQDPEQTGGYRANCEKPKDREDSDLCAQWGAVKAVRESNRIITEANSIAEAGLWFGGVEIFLLFVSFLATAFAAVYSGRSARIATTAVYSDRAWVTFDRYDVASSGNVINKEISLGPGLGISIIWMNTGKTPALQMRVQMDMRKVQTNDPPPFFAERTNLLDKATVTLGPDRDQMTSYEFITGTELQEFHERKLKLVVYSCVTYTDLFQRNVTRTSQICMEIMWDGVRIEEGEPRPLLWANPAGPQNTVD